MVSGGYYRYAECNPCCQGAGGCPPPPGPCACPAPPLAYTVSVAGIQPGGTIFAGANSFGPICKPFDCSIFNGTWELCPINTQIGQFDGNWVPYVPPSQYGSCIYAAQTSNGLQAIALGITQGGTRNGAFDPNWRRVSFNFFDYTYNSAGYAFAWGYLDQEVAPDSGCQSSYAIPLLSGQFVCDGAVACPGLPNGFTFNAVTG